MPLSYLSQPYKPEPYVQPFDLNIMAKVLGTEQQKFDEEGKKIQNQIDQFGSLDVIKGVDRDYLNNKINSLVSGINDLGGVNLADQKISSRIEGMGSEIYGDKNVVNAVAATRQIRSLQASYEKMKTDPKLSKQYSKTNEDWDNQFVNAYAQDNKVGSTYSGPNSATPYAPYRDNLIKAAQGLKANMIPNITSDGVTFTTIEGKTITPQRVMQMSADLLLPDEKLQLEKDGWGAFRNANPLDVVQQSLNFNNQKVQDSQMLLDKYVTEAAASGADPVAQSKYKNLIAAQRDELNQLTAASKEIQRNGLQKYNADPHGYMAQVYKDQFYRGMGERFANSEISAKITNNPMAIAQMRMQQQEDQFNQRMLATAIEKGLEYAIDPKSGKVMLTGRKSLTTKTGKIVPTGSDLATLPIPDVNDPDLYKKSEQGFINQNKELDIKKADLFNSYWQQYLNDHPDVSELLQSNQSGSGVSRILTGQKLLEGLNGQEGLQLEDLNFDPNSPIVSTFEKGYAAKTGQTLQTVHQKVLSVRKIYDDYDKLSHLTSKSDIDPSTVDPKLSSVVEQYQLLDEQKSANEEKMKGINDVIANQANLSAEDRAILEDYRKHPEKYPGSRIIGASPGGFSNPTITGVNDKIGAIYQKIASAGVNSVNLKNTYYQDVSNRPVYNHLVFTKDDPLLEKGWLQNTISRYISANGSTDKQLPAGVVIPESSIFPTDAGRNKSNTGYSVTANIKIGEDSNKQPVYKSIDMDLTPQQATQLGFNNDPYQALNEAVALKGSSNPMLIAAKGANGKTLVTKIRIVKDDLTDRSSQSAHAQLVVKTEDGTQYINLPNVAGETSSEVYATMKTAVQQFANQGLTLPLIVTQLLNQGK